MRKIYKKNKFHFLLLVVFLLSIDTIAQEFQHEIGLRGGVSSGISYKYINQEGKALEALLTFRKGGMQMTALVEKFRPMAIGNQENFFIYTGIGMHAGFTLRNRYKIYDHPYDYYYEWDYRFLPVVGMDAIIGIEYRFYDLPISMSLDAKPYIEIIGEPFFRVNLWDFGFTFRYHLK